MENECIGYESRYKQKTAKTKLMCSIKELNVIKYLKVYFNQYNE